MPELKKEDDDFGIKKYIKPILRLFAKTMFSRVDA
jgi:hypothetical protein